jgi:hypothetical protein
MRYLPNLMNNLRYEMLVNYKQLAK